MHLVNWEEVKKKAGMSQPNWGPTGKDVYDRTYSRTKPDGTKENWYETVERVVRGNISLVDPRYIEDGEADLLRDGIYNFRIIPAGRHLWMSGVEGRQFLFNCYVSGWGDSLSEHFTFTFNQLMEGGGVGSNYSSKYLDGYCISNLVSLHIVCDPEHENYEDLKPYLSNIYDSSYLGAYEVEDSREGWTGTLEWLINLATNPDYDHSTARAVIDVSNIRPAGKRIKTFGGTSAGPAPLTRMLTEINGVLNRAFTEGFSPQSAMQIDHAIATCVVSGNVRRSARMAIMHWDDPEIFWFLECKALGQDFWSTNISVEIDDEFIYLINTHDGVAGHDRGPYTDKYSYDEFNQKAAKAHEVYKAIVDGMLKNGEPGIWNSSLSNTGEPNPVVATNPCGEIALEAWENCNLGHVNLDAFVLPDGSVDFAGLLGAHRLMTRFLMRATFGDISNDRTRAIVQRNRRIGVGHLGFAGYVAKQGIRFSQSYREGIVTRSGKTTRISRELQLLRNAVREFATEYAHELRIPVPVKTTTVAPTGTVAKLAGRSEGIHPIYARYFIRRIRYSMVDPDQAARIEEFAAMGYGIEEDISTPNTWVVSIPTKESLVQELEDLGIDPKILESVDEISILDLLGVQEMYQTYYADNAVSYTINIPNATYRVDDVMDTLKLYLSTLKGTTIMVDSSREQAPYERITEEEYKNSIREIGTGDIVDDSYDENCSSGACPVR